MKYIILKRRGAALIVALVLIAFLGIVAGTLLPQILRDRQESRQDLLRVQSQQLLEDALHRAEEKRKSEPAFSGETLTLGPDRQPYPGTFQISIRLDDDSFVAHVEYHNAKGKMVYTTQREQTGLVF